MACDRDRMCHPINKPVRYYTASGYTRNIQTEQTSESMARVFPTPLPDSVRKHPGRQAEAKLYDAIAKLPDPYVAYYSVSWIDRIPRGVAQDAEADFVVIHPEKGILIIEAKGGGIARDSSTGDWLTINHKGERHKIRNPAEQAVSRKHGLVRQLKYLPDWTQTAFISHAIAFPDLQERETSLTPDLPKEIVLFGPDLKYLEEKLDSTFGYWKNESGRSSHLSESQLGALHKFFAPNVELRLTLGNALRETDEKIFQLTSQQFAVLRCNRRNARVGVAGGAGTGKTLLAMEKAREFARDGMNTLFVCFNKPLADYVKAALTGTEGITVSTFHGLCHDYAERASLPVLPLGTLEVPKDYFSTQLPAELAEALLKRPDDRFNAVVVDEAQDIEDAWWPLILQTLHEPEEQPLWVFYDPNQRFYRQVTSFPSFTTELTLDENLRNTKPIQQFAAQFCDNDEFVPAGPDGPPVEQFTLPTGSKLPDALEIILDRLIRTDGIPPEEIAILTGVSLKKSQLAGLTRIGGWAVTPSDRPARGEIVLETIHRFKGLERQAVILVETGGLLAPTDDEKKNRDHRNLMYVGCTRARGLLLLPKAAEHT